MQKIIWKMLRTTRFLNGIKNASKSFERFHSSIASEWLMPDKHLGHDTGIIVYNCVHRGNVPFIVRNSKCVTWYTCGPTVYDEAHIGHAVCYMKSDIIQRILRKYFHLNLITAMNITDIDDKIINRSNLENIQWQQLAQKYEENFWNDIDALGIQRPDIIVRVSDCIPKIIAFIQKLLDKNAAYIGSDGSVYYANHRENAKLQNIESTTIETKLPNQSVRKSIKDFALWKSAKPNEPHWNVPWIYEQNVNVSTAGRPGWHTECSAMATELFGNQIDVHAGGIDLKFPHHENEESQCCSYHDIQQWVNYWFHIGHLVTTDNVKMSKSLKNVISIKEFRRHYSSDQLRMVCLLSTYHQHIQFGDDILLHAGDILKRFISFFDDTEHFLQHQSMHLTITNRNEILEMIETTISKIDVALKTDFDTRTCIICLLELITQINKAINQRQQQSQQQQHSPISSDTGCGFDAIKSGQNVVRRFLEIVGFTDIISNAFEHKTRTKVHTEHGSMDRIKLENLINDLMEFREMMLNDAKQTKNTKLFELCDQLRETLRKNDLIIKDHGNNTKSTWHFDNVITSRKNHTKL